MHTFEHIPSTVVEQCLHFPTDALARWLPEYLLVPLPIRITMPYLVTLESNFVRGNTDALLLGHSAQCVFASKWFNPKNLVHVHPQISKLSCTHTNK